MAAVPMTDREALLAPLLPDGVEYSDLYPVEISQLGVDEAIEPLTALAAKDTEAKLERSRRVLSPREYKAVLKVQDALRQSYAKGIDSLLAEAERRGPDAVDSILRRYRAMAHNHLNRAHRLGLRLTARGPIASAKDRIWEAYIDARADHDRLHFRDFLNSVWNKTEVLDRGRRRDLYANNLDSMFHQGSLAGTEDEIEITWKLSPAEHCYDCIALAANGPYAKPGVRSPLETLPTVPRRGDTQCLANCKCYLEFVDAAGVAVDPGPKDGVSIEGEDDEPVPPNVQGRADALHRDILYYKAQFELTGDRKWLDRRKTANEALIDLQEETGLRFVKRAESDAMLGEVKKAQGGGWELANSADAARLAPGQTVGVVKGTEFHRGVLTDWDVAGGGHGEFESLTGETFEVGTRDATQTFVLTRGHDQIPAIPWKITQPPKQPGIAFDIPGRSNAIVDVVDAVPEMIREVRRTIGKIPQAHSHGVTTWLLPSKRGKFGATGAEVLEGGGVIGLYGVPTAEVSEHVIAAVGASLYHTVTSSLRERFRAAYRRHLQTVSPKMGLVSNATAGEAAFGATYLLYLTSPEALPPVLARAMKDALEDVAVGVE